MIRTLIIEDEIDARKGLIKMLAAVSDGIEIIAETGYVSEAIELIRSKKPQLVLMDIELEDGNSFEILKALTTVEFKLIFTTAYSDYAIKAFKYSAIDYLLKPISPLELKEAIKKAVLDIENETQYQELLEMVKNKGKERPTKIVLKTSNQRFVINIDTIIRLEADTAYTLFVTTTQKIIISKNLKYYQDLLDDSFIRCHQSHLINSKHLTSITNKGIVMSNDEIIPVSTRKKSEILQYLKNL